MRTLLHRLGSIVAGLFRRDSVEAQLDDELRTFVDMAAAEKVREGLSPAEARRMALLELGGVEQVKEQVRTGRHGALLDEVVGDVRYAFRAFRRNPGFTATIVLTLALGIGANAAIFGLIDALLLRWLPVSQPQELVLVRRPGPFGESFSYPIVRALDGQRQIFSSVAGFSGRSLEIGPPGSVTRVQGAIVTGGFYETLGLRPAAGRLLTRGDDEPGALPAAVISDGFWERQWNRRPDVVGQTIRIHGVPVPIVGVSPPGFVGVNVGSVADVTLTAAALPQVNPREAGLLGPGNFWMRALARPRTGVPAAQAAARLNAAWPQFADAVVAPHWPADRRKEMAESTFELVPGGTGYSYLREIYRQPLFVLMAVAAIVLLIASANVASLLLARARARRREIAVRLAMGAGIGRIVRQVLIESTLLSLIGAAFGVGLAWASSRVLVDMISTGPLQVAFDLTPDWHLLGFASAVAIATGLLFGVAPAVQAATAPSLREEARATRTRSRLLSSLVSAQVALSLVLLAGAGLFVRTLQNLQDQDSGFTPENVLLVDLDRPGTASPEDLLEETRRLAAVASAGLTTHTPLSGSLWSEAAVPVDQPLPDRETALFVGADPGFFSTLQIRVLAGRDFTAGDTADVPGVAIVNEAFTRRFFPNQPPVGQRLSAMVDGERRELAIVGLVKNTSVTGLRTTPPRMVYVPYAQLPSERSTTLVLRVTGPTAPVAAAVQQIVRAKVPDAAIDVRPFSSQVQATIVQDRMVATLAGAFGLLALTLACVGLYGLLAYRVVQRTNEIGIRVALGAHAGSVVGLVFKDGARLVIAGIVVGLPFAWSASRLIESMLFGVTATDPATMLTAVVVMIAAAQIAASLPASRAARVDPLVALRHE
jgi:predicted permease